jgi:hypothetical protein
VTTFVAGWLTTGGGSIHQRYARGDLDFNGITNLADRVNQALGNAVVARRQGVPEPTTFLLLASGVLLIRAMNRQFAAPRRK